MDEMSKWPVSGMRDLAGGQVGQDATHGNLKPFFPSAFCTTYDFRMRSLACIEWHFSLLELENSVKHADYQ